MDNLSLVRSFVAVVERDSFTRAAAHLGLSKGRVSAQIKELEAELGIALFTRTTREVVVTDAGRRFFEHGMHLLQMADAAVSTARIEHESLVGELRVTTTVEYAEHMLVAALAGVLGAAPAPPRRARPILARRPPGCGAYRCGDPAGAAAPGLRPSLRTARTLSLGCRRVAALPRRAPPATYTIRPAPP